MKQKLLTALLVLLLFVLNYTAFSKLFNFTHYARSMYAQPFPRWSSTLLIYMIPALELCIAVLLLLSTTRKLAYRLTAMLMTCFTAYVIYIKVMGLEKKTCPCGGLFSNMSWNQHLWINCSLTLLSCIGAIYYSKK